MRDSKTTRKKNRSELTLLTFPKGKSSLYLKLGVVAAILFAMVTIIDQEMEIAKRQQQLAGVMEQVRVKEMLNEEMEWMVQNSDNHANYERIARTELGLVKPDERVFVFVTGEEE